MFFRTREMSFISHVYNVNLSVFIYKIFTQLYFNYLLHTDFQEPTCQSAQVNQSSPNMMKFSYPMTHGGI